MKLLSIKSNTWVIVAIVGIEIFIHGGSSNLAFFLFFMEQGAINWVLQKEAMLLEVVRAKIRTDGILGRD